MSGLDTIIARYEVANRGDFINTRLRIDPELHVALMDSAEANERSFNSELCYRLAVSLKEHPIVKHCKTNTKNPSNSSYPRK